MRTDLIADAFTIIRNGTRAKKEEVEIPYSQLLLKICEILKRENFIENFKEIELLGKKKIKVYLKYLNKKSTLNEIKRISKPGRRVYLSKDKINSVLNGYGIGIFSTSRGILTDKEARNLKVGGEFIGIVW